MSTPYLKLLQPTMDDKVSPEPFNTNSTLIDNWAKSLSTTVQTNTNNITKINNTIANLPVTGFCRSMKDTITITAPYDCIAEVYCSSSRWGYAGEAYSFGIKCDKNIPSFCISWPTCVAGDLVARPMVAHFIFTGLKKGTQYTFSRLDDGRSGGDFHNDIAVFCIQGTMKKLN